MKKRLLSLVLCLVMVFSLLPFSGFAAPEDDGFEEATPADGRVWRASDDYSEDLYAYVDRDGDGTKEYVKVSPISGEFHTAIDKPDGWTAQQAADAKAANTRPDKDLYWTADNNNYQKVVASAEQYYKNAGEIQPETFITDARQNYYHCTNNKHMTSFNGKFFYNSSGKDTILTKAPSWHQVYENTTGVIAVTSNGGYYVDLWYYNTEGNDFITSSYRDVLDYTSQYKNAMGSTISRVVQENPHTDNDHPTQFDAFLSTNSLYGRPSVPYDGGALYYRINNSTKINSLKTINGQVLAWPLTQEDSTSSVVPGSSTYTQLPLYYHDTGVKQLVYAGTQTQLDGSQTAANYTGQLYDGKLYYKLPDNTRYVVDDPAGETLSYSDGSKITNPAVASDATGKVKLDKTLTQADSDHYTLTLEGYSVAGGTTVRKTIKTPTDFVVVVDESGSMNDSDIPASYSAVSAKTLEQVAAGNYYVNVNGEYYRVFAKRGYLFEKFPSNTLWTNDIVKDSEEGLHWFQSNTTQSFSKANQYYIHEDGGAFRPVTVTVKGVVGTYYVKFFTYPGGVETDENKVYFDRGSEPKYHSVTGGTIEKGDLLYGAVNGAVKTLYPDSEAYTYSTFVGIKTGMFINRDMYKRHVGYTGLYYRDMNGNEWPVQIAGSSLQTDTEYCNSNGEAVTTDGGSDRMTYQGLYQAGRTMTRLDALKTALRDFAAAVAADSDDNGVVQNRVAVVGFSDQLYSHTNGTLISASDNGAVSQALSNAIDAIGAHGGTQPEIGFNEARRILDARSDADKSDRNTVVIFFTDGRPGNYGWVDQYGEANDAVAAAYNLKHAAGYEAKIYSIGVFGESDGNPLLYPRNEGAYSKDNPPAYSRNNDYEYEGGFMEKILKPYTSNDYYYMKRQWRPDNDNYTETPNDTIYDYMSVVSSNYPNAQEFIATAWLTGGFTPKDDYVAATNGVRDFDTYIGSNEYYRMASTQATLVAAFEEAITKTVEIHYADTTTAFLGDSTEIRDKINIDMFNVERANYTVKLVPVKAFDTTVETVDGMTYQHWKVVRDDSRDDVILGTYAVPDTGIITAKGLDYASEYVNRRHEGYKLVVEVTGLEPKQYNTDIASNYGNAGIYPSGESTPMVSIEPPIVNVHKPDVTVTWKNWDNSTLETDSVPYGGVPEYLGQTPTREPDENNTYTFSGWDPEVGPITQDTTYVAKFDENPFVSKFVVADFNSEIVLAEDSSSENIKDVSSANGKFDVNAADQAYYQLNSDKINGTNTSADNAVDLTPYSGSDFARIFGRHVDIETGEVAEEATWQKITVYPATNIYFSDNTATVTSNANNQIGFAEGVVPDSAVNDGATTSGSRYFVVKGTRVDVYGTTSTESGTITAYLYTKNDDGELVRFKTKMVSMRSEAGTHTRYDAPIVSFSQTLDDMNPDTTYYLRVYAPAAAKLRLDGIRVYNADNNDVEKNAKYVNLRDVLLKADDALDLSDDMSAEGVVFFTDKGNLDANDHAIQDLDELIGQDDAYKKNIPIDYKNVGPKNEVYLSEGQAVGFQVKDGCKVMVSMRVPEGGNAQLQINGSTDLMFLDSSVDMYYPIQPNADGVVLIKNVTPKGDKVVEITEEEFNEHQGEDGYRYDTEVNKYFKVENNVDTFVSLMNVKITDSETAAPGGSRTLMASPKMLRFAVNPDVQTEEPAVETPAVESPTVETPEPTTQPSIISIISQLLSSFVNSLFSSISRLFGN